MSTISEGLAIYCAVTDVGRVRANNEDAVVVDAANGIAVLADGMGGYNAGEVASALAVDLICSELGRWLGEAAALAQPRDIRRAMEICVDNANRSIFEAAYTHDAYAGMGTTLVMTVLQRETLLIGHVGDSRAYRYREGLLQQLTRDHSLLQEQVDMGLITEQEAAGSANRNLVTRALGVEDTVLLDVQEQAVEPGDLYLLCSDGLTDLVPDADIAAILGDGTPMESQAQALVALANGNGGRDNISLVLCQVPKVPKKQGVIEKLLRK